MQSDQFSNNPCQNIGKRIKLFGSPNIRPRPLRGVTDHMRYECSSKAKALAFQELCRYHRKPWADARLSAPIIVKTRSWS